MKKLFFYLILFSITASLKAADPLVRFNLSDGTNNSYVLADITNVQFKAITNSTYLLTIYSNNSAKTSCYYLTSTIDSLRFENDNLKKRFLSIYTVADKKSYLLENIDSIIFDKASTSIPLINTFSPSTVAIGSEITLNGSNFGNSKGSTSFVSINGVQATSYSTWSDTKIVATIPAKATSGDVFVSVNDNTSNLISVNIGDVAQKTPVISYLPQTTVTILEQIEIIGSNFGNSIGNNSVVYFGDIVAPSYEKWNDSIIYAEVPKYAVSGKLKVVVNGLTSNEVSYTVHQQNYYIDMVLIPTGEFTMGVDSNADLDNSPAHKVKITKQFYMGKYEVTQKQWATVFPLSNPSQWKCDSCPVEQVWFKRALEFCNTLSKLTNLDSCYTISGDTYTCDFTKDGFRLPTEAEWEYVCRAGTTGSFDVSTIDNMGWTSDNATNNQPHAVGQKTPNSFGVYDIFGNVAEWCWDYYVYDYYSSSPTNDPTGPATSDVGDRVMRGGNFSNGPDNIQPYKRDSHPSGDNGYEYYLGFRVVRNY